MSNDWTFFPFVMTAQDLAVMREAMRLAERSTTDEQKERLAHIIFRYYKRGMTDAGRLAEIAVFLSSSRAFAYPREQVIAVSAPQPAI